MLLHAHIYKTLYECPKLVMYSRISCRIFLSCDRVIWHKSGCGMGFKCLEYYMIVCFFFVLTWIIVIYCETSVGLILKLYFVIFSYNVRFCQSEWVVFWSVFSFRTLINDKFKHLLILNFLNILKSTYNI